MRLAVLRAAVERASGSVASVTSGPHGQRITVPASSRLNSEQWGHLLSALQTADAWGSGDATGAIVVWAEITEGTGHDH
jgi:hypothetical protein